MNRTARRLLCPRPSHLPMHLSRCQTCRRAQVPTEGSSTGPRQCEGRAHEHPAVTKPGRRDERDGIERAPSLCPVCPSAEINYSPTCVMPTGETSARRRSTNKGAARRYEAGSRPSAALHRPWWSLGGLRGEKCEPSTQGYRAHVFTNTSEHVYECTGVRECECTNVSTCAATARQRRDDRRAASRRD